jgi:hypothetical protein
MSWSYWNGMVLNVVHGMAAICTALMHKLLLRPAGTVTQIQEMGECLVMEAGLCSQPQECHSQVYPHIIPALSKRL